MEDRTTLFFINGIKIHIKSSIDKVKDNNDILFNENFDNILINPLFINNINLFREIINKNNLNFKIFWNHIGKIMNTSIQSLIKKFQDEINIKKDISDKEEIENKNKEKNLIDTAEINLLKLNILNLCLNLIINENLDNLDKKEENKENFQNLLEELLQKAFKYNIDISLFVKNYIIILTLIINDNGKEINISFLKFLSFLFYNFESMFNKNEIIRQLNIYINHVINNPKSSLNNYLYGAFNKKKNKNVNNNRSRRGSFDNKDINVNNNNCEKKNKKIIDYFKKEPKYGKENENNKKIIKDKNNIIKQSNCLKNNSNLDNLLNNKKEFNDNEINNKNNKRKLEDLISNEDEQSLFNFGSNISKNSNSFFLSNSISFLKHNNYNNSKLNLNDSLNMSKLFSTPISELNEKNENKENKKMPYRLTSLIKCLKSKKRKPLEKLRNILFNSQMNIKKYMTIENKNKQQNNEKIKELRKVVNLDFYGNKIEDKHYNSLTSEKTKKNLENKENKGDNVLMAKTPTKNVNMNTENIEMNIQDNINMNKMKKSWQLLFSQSINY